MTLQNAKVLYKHFKDIGRDIAAEQLVVRYPELKSKPKSKEVAKDAKV